jgi:hypothetical protein
MKTLPHENVISSRAAAIQRSGQGGNRGHEEGGHEEEADPRIGGVSGLIYLIV